MTRLYETPFHFAAAVVLWELKRRGLFQRQLFKLYVISYLLFRFATEYLRPEAPLWLGMTGYQWAALWLAAVFAGLWWWSSRDREKLNPADEWAVDG